MTHRLKLGKIDYTDNGQKDNLVVIEWDFCDGAFSMRGKIYNRLGTDILSGGQNLNEILSHFPNHALFQRMHSIWHRWHLNHHRAGSPAQEEKLRNFTAHTRDWYGEATRMLTESGLNPDPDFLYKGKPYIYGSAWLFEEIPPYIAAEIESWSALAS